MWGPCWVGRSTFVSDVCNVPVVVVRCVRHNLNAAVRQGNPVTALLHWENLASTNSIIFFISSFSSLLFTRLWRVPATQPYPTWNFFTTLSREFLFKLSEFRVVTITYINDASEVKIEKTFYLPPYLIPKYACDIIHRNTEHEPNPTQIWMCHYTCSKDQEGPIWYQMSLAKAENFLLMSS